MRRPRSRVGTAREREWKARDRISHLARALLFSMLALSLMSLLLTAPHHQGMAEPAQDTASPFGA